MSNSYIYRFHSTATWGIYVEITAELIRGKPLLKEQVQRVTENVLLQVAIPFRLTSQEHEYLIRGVEMVSRQMEAQNDMDFPYFIRVLDLCFNECDYQPEGLACAVAGWIAQECGFPAVSTPVTFDREQQKYVFDFPARNG